MFWSRPSRIKIKRSGPQLLPCGPFPHKVNLSPVNSPFTVKTKSAQLALCQRLAIILKFLPEARMDLTECGQRQKNTLKMRVGTKLAVLMAVGESSKSRKSGFETVPERCAGSSASSVQGLIITDTSDRLLLESGESDVR